MDKNEMPLDALSRKKYEGGEKKKRVCLAYRCEVAVQKK